MSIEQPIGPYDDPQKAAAYLEANKGASDFDGVNANVFRYIQGILPADLSAQVALDLGCGNGRWSEELCRRRAADVYAIDVSPAMIEQAKERQQLKQLASLHLVVGDMRALPLKESSIDMAFSSFSLMYFNDADLERIFQELKRVTRPGAMLYIATNIIASPDKEFLLSHKGEGVPVDLGFEKKMRGSNPIQLLETYQEAIARASFQLTDEKHFVPEGAVIVPEYEHYDTVFLDKVVMTARKM
jgi:SAM-dependent methyltransferase